MKIKTESFRKVTLIISVAGFLLGASSCASTKSGTKRRSDTAQSYNQKSKSGQIRSGLPDRASQTWEQKNDVMKGPNKPQQANYQQRVLGPSGGSGHDNGLGAAIGGVLFWILNGLSGGNR